MNLLGSIAQSVASLTVDPWVPSSIPVWSHTFVEIDHEIISMVILLLTLIQEGFLSVTSKSIHTNYWFIALSGAALEKSVVW